MHPQPRALVSVVVWLLISLGLFIDSSGSASSVPSDLKVLAKFGSGSIDPGNSVTAFRVTIDANGKTKIEANRFPKGIMRTQRTTANLPQRALEQIVTAIDRSAFFSLPPDMSGQVTDSPGYSLEITWRGRTRKVRVYAPYDVHDKASLRRFLSVWQAIFQAILPPDGGDALKHLRVNS